MFVRLHLTNKDHQVDDIQTSTSFQVLGGMRKLISQKKKIFVRALMFQSTSIQWHDSNVFSW